MCKNCMEKVQKGQEMVRVIPTSTEAARRGFEKWRKKGRGRGHEGEGPWCGDCHTMWLALEMPQPQVDAGNVVVATAMVATAAVATGAVATAAMAALQA